MPITGGTYIRTDGTRTGSTVNVTAANAGVKNTAALADARENDLASGINGCMFRDGSNAATGDQNMGSKKITALADGSASTDAATKGQMDTAIAAKFSVFGASLALAADAAAGRAILTPFPSGTPMLFVQSTAPTGWTKSITHNDKALRVVSGTASSGGTVAFSTAFASITPTGTVGGTAITTAQLPSHTHTGTTGGQSATHTHVENVNGLDQDWGTGVYSDVSGGRAGGGTRASPISTGNASNDHTHSFTSDGTGSGQTHTHSWTGDAINLSVSHVDCIIATKD